MERTRHCSRIAAMGRRLLAGTCLMALAAYSGQAWAQDNSTNSSAADSTNVGLKTVTVTARFTTENLQRTPIAISTTSAAQLKAANVTNIDTLGSLVPNLHTHMGDADESFVPTIVMRGVQQNDASFAEAPAVAIYIDGVYHPTAAGSQVDLTDVDRVEVDRGPQSTLSGNASIGGAIKIFTKKPTGDGSGYLSATYGSYDKIMTTGAFDMTVAPNLFARVSGHFKRQDGYVTLLDFTCEMNQLGTPALAGSLPTAQPDASARGCKIGEEGGGTEAGARLRLRWVPNDRLEVNLNTHVEKIDNQASPEVTKKITNPYPNPNGLVNFYNVAIENQFGVRYDNRFLPPPGKPYSSYSSFCRPLLQGVVQQPPYQPVPSGICYPNSNTFNSKTTSGTVDYQITDNVHLMALAAYSDYSTDYIQNGDQSPLGYILSHFSQKVRSTTGEVRLNGTLFNDKLSWVLGTFLMSYSGQSNGFIGYLTLNFNEFDRAVDQSESGFFHVDYNLTDRWRFSGGARWTWGKLKYTFNHPGLLVVNTPFSGYEHHWDWLASTDYQITDNTMAYATVATGSRPPGVTTIIITPQQLHSTPGESMTSYEVGLKNEFFNNRVRFNIDGFYADYSRRLTPISGVQCLGELPGATWHASAADCAHLYPSNPTVVPWTISVGKPATITGFEWDLTAEPIYDLLLNFSGGYNHFQSGVTTPGQPGYIHPGNHLQPEWNMHADAQYTFVTGVGSFTPRLDWSWQSQQDFDPAPAAEAPQPDYIVKPYSLLNGQISYVPLDSRWSATFAVTNLTDEMNYTQLFGGPAISVDISSNVGPPREFSFTLRRSF